MSLLFGRLTQDFVNFGMVTAALDSPGQAGEEARANLPAAAALRPAARVARAIDEGEPLLELPRRLIEENMWRAIRHGLSGELIDFERGQSVPARKRLEQVLEWVRPVAAEIGASGYLAVPEQNAAERQYARRAEGASHAEIYRELLVTGARVS